jgi:hypothetical protein
MQNRWPTTEQSGLVAMTKEAVGTPDEDIDTRLGERYYRDQRELEEALIDEIIDITRQFIDRRFREGRRPALRDAHAKETGCVRATFRVDPDLNSDLHLGIFVPQKEYNAWIRFSNGNSELLSDRWPDARGMAIKLMDVPGPKLLNDETLTQDFIMANNPIFFVDDLKRYTDTLLTFHSGGPIRQYLAAFRLRWREALLALKVNFTLISNPLLSPYWSMTPYRLGADSGPKYAIKFLVKPRLSDDPRRAGKWPRLLAFSFSLKDEISRVLSDHSVCFDFYIQRCVGQRTPIEDSTVEWEESVAKPEHVAEVTIPVQDVVSALRDQFCENLSFNPWHCLSEHKPLGAVNRVRRRVYLEISEFRHKLNGVAKQEPTKESVP